MHAELRTADDRRTAPRPVNGANLEASVERQAKAESAPARRWRGGGRLPAAARAAQLATVERQANAAPANGEVAALDAALNGGRAVVAQRTVVAERTVVAQRASALGRGGLPEELRAGLERLSGFDLSALRVRYGSSAPAQLNAYAFTRGSEIHLAPGQQRHLAHEGWHAVQQMQGRVRPTARLGATPINDDVGLEREADRMGARAASLGAGELTAQRRAALGAAAGGGGRNRENGTVQRCGCGGTCGCGAGRKEKPLPGVVQRAPCGDDGVEWYYGDRGAAAHRLIGGTGMDVAPDLAHILCCSFCRAMIQTVVEGGQVNAGRLLRYTTLFENLVHRYDAETGLYGGGVRNVFTEEAYWLPANAANFSAASGLPLQNSHLLDAPFVAAVQPVLAASFNTPAGVYPAGLPAAEQAGFDALRNSIPVAAPVAVPAGGRRRSYASNLIRNSPEYAALRWLSLAPGAGGGTAWDALRQLGGRMRVLDFAGERAAPGAALRHTVADAKFSYAGGRFDDWGPGQAADQQAIYQQLSGGGPGVAVPVVTWDRCACNEELREQRIFQKLLHDKRKARGKRRETYLTKQAGKRAQSSRQALLRPNSATMKWRRK